ncbi:hypothetical protein QBC35DRAFT_454769 [Podospora australis]|uniref:Transmembrane protein n=1 Tax=Podospora australis TaxID=1536484 RepID=A0AAN6WN57_9PEZI|nr:hypothetical protein QBC35DRAFT_454769 [Podospora australis]
MTPWFAFSYPITREYPYRWFSWVTYVGGFLFAILFTVFSLATKGYYLEVIYTRNPNITEAELYWFSRAPFSWTDPLSAACQPTELQVGTKVFTDKLWRSYTISSVTVSEEDSPKNILQPVIVYKNNPLENCTVDTITLHVRNETSMAEQYKMASSHFVERIDARADITCHVATHPPAVVRFSSTLGDRPGAWYSPNGAALSNFSEISQSQLDKSNVILADMLFSQYDTLIVDRQLKHRQLLLNTTNNTSPIPPFDLNPAIYSFSQDKTDPPKLITSPTFFKGFRLVPRTQIPTSPSVTTDFTMELLEPIDLPPGMTAPPPSMKIVSTPEIITRTAKLFYSLLLADLGQDHRTSTITTDPALLGEYLDYVIKETDPSLRPNWQIYNFWRNATSVMKPGNESTIYTQYTCQVPRQRVTGSVVIAVMVSDLVLLQALWAVFTWGTMWWMQRTHNGQGNDLMACVGCADDKQKWMMMPGRRTLTGVTVTEVAGGPNGSGGLLSSSSDEEKRVGSGYGTGHVI